MAAREAGVTTLMNEGQEIDTLKKDIRDAGGELVRTISEIRARVSYEALKSRALAEVHEVAVEKPRQIAGTAFRGAYGYAQKAQKMAREHPILPLMIGIVILAPLMVGRIMHRRR